MLGKVRITDYEEQDTTSVSNAFIDEFMADANDAQIKIYLYLLRALQSGSATTVPELADRFNHTERDVKQALRYWEKKGLVRLEYDSKKRLSQICLEDLHSSLVHSVTVSETAENEKPGSLTVTAPKENNSSVADSAGAKKNSGTPSDGTDPNLSMLLFAAQSYFKRILSSSETSAIVFIYENLGFPVDLIDYLLQYTAENAEKRRYASFMQSTAIGWDEEGIRTLKAAKSRPGRFGKNAYAIMKALGLRNEPTDFEAGYFNKWLKEYEFSMPLIKEACRRAVANVQDHRIEYADKILTDWHTKAVKSIDDIAVLDEAHEKQSASSPTHDGGRRAAVNTNKFNSYKQNDYDFEDIENRLVINKQRV